MNTEIQKDKWAEFFATLSKRRFEWKTDVEVLGPDLGDQMLTAGMPFNGITLEGKGDKMMVDISIGDTLGMHQTHMIANPTRVAFLEADECHGDVVDIEEADGTKTLITFLEPRGILVGFAEFEGVAAYF